MAAKAALTRVPGIGLLLHGDSRREFRAHRAVAAAMDDLVFYPVQDYGPVMKGLAIGGLGIVHVFLAQFAIGAGMLMCWLQWRAWRRGDELARRFLDSYFTVLILVSFVLGAVTGVAMWFTSIQVSPATIGLMVEEFHWIWATEWTFFCIEIGAGYMFYRWRERLCDPTRMLLLGAYSAAGWMSLFWINGILSWQLTPGGWSDTGSVWAGFFNPSFWPSLVYRTLAATTLAALVAILVVHGMGRLLAGALDRDRRAALIRRISVFFLPMAGMPLVGAWYLAVMPGDSRSWVLGGSPTMSLFFGGAVLASTLLGLYVLLGLWRRRLYVNGATAALLLALAFVATAAGEFVREGVRKPYTVRGALYSNSLEPGQIEELRSRGSVHLDPYPLREELPNPQLATGAKVLRMQCSVCHTLSGANGLTHLLGSWQQEQMRMNIAKLQHTKPFMPPFAGTPAELESLVQYLRWVLADRPAQWPETRAPEVLDRIRGWLMEAGSSPAAPREGLPR